MKDREYIEIEGIPYSTYAGLAAYACKKKFRGLMGEELLISKLTDFVTLMLLNNKFCDKGIFISDDNKEECYIKIIELGDESLIEDLEKFIALKDNIKHIEDLKCEYNDIIQQLQNLQNSNDEIGVNKIVEAYLRR